MTKLVLNVTYFRNKRSNMISEGGGAALLTGRIDIVSNGQFDRDSRHLRFKPQKRLPRAA